jgi:hypothetical protein
MTRLVLAVLNADLLFIGWLVGQLDSLLFSQSGIQLVS